MNRYSLILIIIAALFSTLGNLFIKLSAEENTFLDTVLNWKFISGLLFSALNLVCFTLALKTLNVSTAYPSLAALSFLFLSIAAYFFLNEKLALINILGIFIILIGIYFLNK